MIKSVFIELHVQNLENHKQLFVEVLGFTVTREQHNFITLSNGLYKVLLTRSKIQRGHQFFKQLNPNTNGYGVEIGIDVDNLEAVFDKCIKFKNVKKVTEIKLQDWGKRDFRVTTLDNYYLRISEIKHTQQFKISNTMKISIIMGSHRPEAQSLKVAKYLSKRLTELKVCDEIYLLNLAEADIPFYDDGLKKKEGIWKTNWEPIENELASSDGFIIVSPEWGGMVPAKLKNFFLLPNTTSMAHKPALIVSVSEGFGGAYPITELRTSSYKNTHICYIPEHIIVRKVKLVLNEEPADNDFDKLIRPRIDFAIKLLGHYCEAFIPLRKSGFNFDEYKFGM